MRNVCGRRRAFARSCTTRWTAHACLSSPTASHSSTSSTDPIILVQDYHFALAPRMLREQLPNATIVAFWHVPWPHSERMGICPWRAELVDGLLGASIIGFHTQLHCNNFIDSVDAFM